jgi:hypothetical protein
MSRLLQRFYRFIRRRGRRKVSHTLLQCFSFAFLLLSIVFHNVLIDFPTYFASKR